MALRFTDITSLHLQYVAGTSAKEYRVVLDRGTQTVTCSWGRIGAVVNSQTFACASLPAAQQLAAKKATAKIDKGYRIVAEGRNGCPAVSTRTTSAR